MAAPSILLTGTTFRSGTTTILTGLCRSLAQQGQRVTPFQAQALTDRSYFTPQGLQIGYAQAMQAWAAGIAPRLEHNPVLLHRRSHYAFDLILGGKVQAEISLEDYRDQHLLQSQRLIDLALERLQGEYALLLCEGLGNPAIPDIPAFELGTAALALKLQCPLVLVVDMSSGGGLTQLLGTLSLLLSGLGFLPLRTIFTGREVSQKRQVTTLYPQVGLPIDGYQVQRGHSQLPKVASNVQYLFDDEELGMVGGDSGDKLAVWGCHLHGLFENGSWRRMWLNRLRQQRGFKALPTGIGNYRFQRDTILDQLAERVETHVDIPRLLEGVQ